MDIKNFMESLHECRKHNTCNMCSLKGNLYCFSKMSEELNDMETEDLGNLLNDIYELGAADRDYWRAEAIKATAQLGEMKITEGQGLINSTSREGCIHNTGTEEDERDCHHCKRAYSDEYETLRGSASCER